MSQNTSGDTSPKLLREAQVKGYHLLHKPVALAQTLSCLETPKTAFAQQQDFILGQSTAAPE
jgi:hypothetical protein